VRNQRWPPGTGSRYEITCSSACVRDSNEIPTATPMFSKASNVTALVQILSYFRVNGISKACNRKLILIYHKFTTKPDVEEYAD